MTRLTAHLWQRYRQWDRPLQWSFGLALLLLLAMLSIIAFGPMSLRLPAIIALVVLLIVAQIIFMWANRGMLTAYGQAQRLYLAENFEGACAVLEGLRQTGRADARALTLLGNALRQRGLLDESEQVLLEALNIQPDHYFPLYGFGRTLLIQGRYAEAAQFVEQALQNGAAPVVGLDAAEAHYRNGRLAEARQWVELALPEISEPHRELMGRYLLYQMNAADRPDKALIAGGLHYWQAQASRYGETPYGHALADDVRAMELLAEEA